MATYSSIFAQRIPRAEEPGGFQSMGSQRVGHDGVTLTLTYLQMVHLFSCLYSLLASGLQVQDLLRVGKCQGGYNWGIGNKFVGIKCATEQKLNWSCWEGFCAKDADYDKEGIMGQRTQKTCKDKKYGVSLGWTCTHGCI